jgi:nucleotide-binding universal stress UspA family protein
MAAEKRTIGMGMDYSPSSKAAARWAVDNLIKAGDRLVLVHVLPKGVDSSHKELWKTTGSRKYNHLSSSFHFFSRLHRKDCRMTAPLILFLLFFLL